MPDPHRIKRELQGLLSRPQFSSMFSHRNQFKSAKDAMDTPESVADRTANYLWTKNPLMDPVEIVQLNGPLEFYRAHDGGASPGSAKTLGGSWIERSVAKTVWDGTKKYQGEERRKAYMEFLRTANFVLPEWNGMLHLACMTVPSGNPIVVVRGRGSWKAMRTKPGVPRPGGAPGIFKQEDVLNSGMMPIPGVMQCVLPLFNDNWIQPVIDKSPKWPLFS